MNPGITYLDWKRSSGWLDCWEGLLFVTDVSTTDRVVFGKYVMWSAVKKWTQTSCWKELPQQKHCRTPLKNKPHYRPGLFFVFNQQYPLLLRNYTRKLVYLLRTNCPQSVSTSSHTLQTFYSTGNIKTVFIIHFTTHLFA